MSLYKTDLHQRYWAYQKRWFPAWQNYLDQPYVDDRRPPVLRRSEAWRNVLVKPDATPLEIARLLAYVPAPDRHKWFGSMNSSQALAQSVFGNLALFDQLHTLSAIADDYGLPLLGNAQTASDAFAMEFKIDYLGEPHPTSLDGYVGGEYRVAIECKFTEAEVGTCSRPRLAPIATNYESEHCNGAYTKQRARLERCSLTEVGVLYWHYIPQLFHWESNRDWDPCPLAAKYQLVRNILAIGVNSAGAGSLTNGHALLLYDERNPAFQHGGAGLAAFLETRGALHEPTMLRKCSWQRITQHMHSRGILSWLTEHLALKYGL
jgi:hypothetical protein